MSRRPKSPSPKGSPNPGQQTTLPSFQELLRSLPPVAAYPTRRQPPINSWPVPITDPGRVSPNTNFVPRLARAFPQRPANQAAGGATRAGRGRHQVVNRALSQYSRQVAAQQTRANPMGLGITGLPSTATVAAPAVPPVAAPPRPYILPSWFLAMTQHGRASYARASRRMTPAQRNVFHRQMERLYIARVQPALLRTLRNEGRPGVPLIAVDEAILGPLNIPLTAPENAPENPLEPPEEASGSTAAQTQPPKAATGKKAAAKDKPKK